MTDKTPDRPAPLTEQEREKLVEEAAETNMGNAVRGAYLKSLVLKSWFADFDPGVLLDALIEAPDGGLETAQKAIDEMPPEQRRELFDRAIDAYRFGCSEAVLQLERLALGIEEDPRQIDAEDVAKVAGLPIVARGERAL